MEKELIDYIKNYTSQGHSLDEIRKALLDVGWNEKNIEEAIDFTLQKSKPRKKFPFKSVFTGIIIALIVGLIGLGVYLYLKESSQPPEEAVEKKVKKPEETEKEEAVDEATKDWRVYQDEEYGFTIKYPSNFVVSILFPDPLEEDPKMKKELEEEGLKTWINIGPDRENVSHEESLGLMYSDISIMVRVQSIEELAEEMREPGPLVGKIEMRNEIVGAGYQAIVVYEEDVKLTRAEEPLTRYASYLVQGPTYSYVLSYNKDLERNRAIVITSQIVNSFRLLE